MKTKVTLIAFALLLPFMSYGHWLTDSLAPVAQECIAVNGETLTVNGELIAVINLMCHTFVNNVHGEEAKYLWINATKKERNRYNGHFYLYD